MEKKYKPKKQTLIWNDIRSGYKPDKGRMLYILVGTDVCIGGYDDLEAWDGNKIRRGQFWDGTQQEIIPLEEVTAWAYLNAPDFEV